MSYACEAACVPQMEIVMTEPRSRLSRGEIALLVAVVAAAALLSLRFVILGAWPVAAFGVADVGLLMLATFIFRTGRPLQECLRVSGREIALIRSDRRGRSSRIVFPAGWTRLATSTKEGVGCDLWLVYRQQHYPVGLCVSASERQRLEPAIRAALAGRNI